MNCLQIVSLVDCLQQVLGFGIPTASCELLTNCIFSRLLTAAAHAALDLSEL